MSGDERRDDDMAHLDVVQDAELLYEAIRAMKRLSTNATSATAMHAMLGHLAVAGHLLPEVLTELGQSLSQSVTFDGEPASNDKGAAAKVDECQALLEQAAALAYEAGTVLGKAQKTLEGYA